MTSKISFFNLAKEGWKHHLTSVFLLTFAYSMKLLFFYFDMESLEVMQGSEATWALKMSIPSFGTTTLVIFFGILLAADYFSYLHSKRKSDFYLSLPIKRRDQFWLGSIVCGVLFVLPFLGELLGEMLLITLEGYGTAEVLQNFLVGGFCCLLIFCATWLTTAFAVIATGNMAIALLGTGLLFVYVPVILASLIPLFEDYFYNTFLYVTERSIGWDIFSPASLAYGLVQQWGIQEIWRQYLVASFFYIGVMGAFAFLLYTKRPAEAAGRAMAFERANQVVKYLLVIPLALYFGWFIKTMSEQDSIGWLIAGTIVGAILLHGIVESIYSFDMHQMWKKRKQMGIAIAGCLLFLFVMKIGEKSYDAFLPNVNELQSVEVLLTNKDTNFYTNFQEADGIRGPKKELALQLAALSVEQDEEAKGTIRFKYHLKNGAVKGREYKIDTTREDKSQLLDQLFASEDFKNDFYYIYHLTPEQVTKIQLDDGVEQKTVDLTLEEKKEFLEICKKDLTKISFTDMESQMRIGKLSFSYGHEYMEESYPIYEQFADTRAFLNARGIEIQSMFDDAEILSLEARSEYGEQEPWELKVEDKVVLEKVKYHMVPSDFYNGDFIHHIRNGSYANVTLEKDGRVMYRDVYLPEDVLQILKNGSES